MVNALPVSIRRTERVCIGILSFTGIWATAGGLVQRYVWLEESNGSMVHSTYKNNYATPIPAVPERLSSETCWPFHSSLPYYKYNLTLDDASYNFIRERIITLAIYLCLGDGEGGDVFTQSAAPCSAPPQLGAHWTLLPAYPADWPRTPGECSNWRVIMSIKFHKPTMSVKNNINVNSVWNFYWYT